MVKYRLGCALAALAVGFMAIPHAHAQQSRPQSQQQAAQLPPALQAAIQSGNAQMVQQAINSLAGGNPDRIATLAAQTIAAAERMLATNPEAAIAAATSAVQVVRATNVQTSAPQQTETVVTTAARILVAPQTQVVSANAFAAIATSVLDVAGKTGNTARTAQVANAAITAAEKLVSTNPTVAVQVATQAMQSIRDNTVLSAQPQTCSQVATTAARIIVSPEVVSAAPREAAAIATATVQVVSNPAVYQSSPTAAINVMANAYATVTSEAVTAVVPNAAADVRSSLVVAAQTQTLNQSNPTNAASINTILGGTDPVTNRPLRDSQVAPQTGQPTTSGSPT